VCYIKQQSPSVIEKQLVPGMANSGLALAVIATDQGDSESGLFCQEFEE
jgi:hypothetical protein